MGKIIVQGLNLEVTESIEAHVSEQFKKVTEHFESFIVENIVVKLEVNAHPSHIKKASVKVPIRGNDISLETESDDMYKSIAELAQKTNRQLRKHKEKVKGRQTYNKRQETNIDED